jgi:acyl-coenzyme A thioesterase PaaI-like protein
MSMRPKPEPVQVVKARRDAALAWLSGGIPYVRFLGIQFDRRGDELTAILPYADKLIGNPAIPALHGGVTSAFLEVTAIVSLAWTSLWEEFETGRIDPQELLDGRGLPSLPRTIDFTVDFLRSGLPRDAYARARILRTGRRYASVLVEAWQDNREKPFALGSVHLLMPQPAGS